MKPKTVIILNAPPASGKDTIARLLVDDGWGMHIGLGYCVYASFKQPIIDIALAICDISPLEWEARYNDRELKEVPWEKAGGLSQRQLLIRISEDWIKPLQGQDYFGKRAAASLRHADTFVFADGGFPAEVKPLVDAGHKVYVFRLYRQGFTFEGDSRNYLPNDTVKNMRDIVLKDGDPLDAVTQIRNFMDTF